MAEVSIKFFHGLGDCANFAHQIPLYISRGYSVSVECTPDKAIMFEAAGAKVVSGAKQTHHWYHAPGPGAPTIQEPWAGSKPCWNVSQPPMPNIGRFTGLWDEYSKVRLNLDRFVTDQNKLAVDSYLATMPKKIILVHTQGNTGQDLKNLNKDETINLYYGLLDLTDAGIILLDWDNRVPKLNNWRLRHLIDDWRGLDLAELYYLITRSNLLIGVDSGPLHFTRFTDTPSIGLWTKHYPSHYSLPRTNTLHIVSGAKKNWNACRRSQFNIVTSPGDITGGFIAKQAVNLLSPARYLDAKPADCMLSHMVDLCRHLNNNGLSNYTDRHKSFAKFLERAKCVTKPVVVETGCIREMEDWSAGYSTYLMGYFLKYHGGNLVSVDFSSSNVGFAREMTKDMPVEVVESHSHDFFRNYTGNKIDFLYLDSADVGVPEYQECCLKEATLAMPHLSDNVCILIDDTCWSKRQFTGKGGLAVPWLQGQGFKVIYGGYQVLLERCV